jgi:hypothetical protein
LNQWIAVAVAQKVGVVETAAEFFRKRSEGARAGGLAEALNRAPNNPPDELDRLVG